MWTTWHYHLNSLSILMCMSFSPWLYRKQRWLLICIWYIFLVTHILSVETQDKLESSSSYKENLCTTVYWQLVGEQMDRRLANDLCPLTLTFWIITCDSWLWHSVCCGDFLKDFITVLGKRRYTKTWVLWH